LGNKYRINGIIVLEETACAGDKLIVTINSEWAYIKQINLLFFDE